MSLVLGNCSIADKNLIFIEGARRNCSIRSWTSGRPFLEYFQRQNGGGTFRSPRRLDKSPIGNYVAKVILLAICMIKVRKLRAGGWLGFAEARLRRTRRDCQAASCAVPHGWRNGARYGTAPFLLTEIELSCSVLVTEVCYSLAGSSVEVLVSIVLLPLFKKLVSPLGDGKPAAMLCGNAQSTLECVPLSDWINFMYECLYYYELCLVWKRCNVNAVRSAGHACHMPVVDGQVHDQRSAASWRLKDCQWGKFTQILQFLDFFLAIAEPVVAGASAKMQVPGRDQVRRHLHSHMQASYSGTASALTISNFRLFSSFSRMCKNGGVISTPLRWKTDWYWFKAGDDRVASGCNKDVFRTSLASGLILVINHFWRNFGTRMHQSSSCCAF